jgi:hypothetical protein|tara:strand:- start:1784 stop:2632 length:849 start_codon:yes stop_codon:yes gene_type:complete
MKITVSVVNNPIFIEIQYYTLKKYFKGEYEFIVFNDAKDFPDFTNDYNITIKKQIQDICSKLKIKCIDIPNSHHKNKTCAGERCADSMNVILQYQILNPDKYLLLDSDMFLVDYFDIEKFSDYDCAVVLQSRNTFRTNYFWNGIYYFDITKMKNLELLNWNTCKYCDVGGMMQHWLQKQIMDTPIPNTDDIRWTNKEYHRNNIYFIKHLWSCSWNIDELPENLNNNIKLIDYIKNDPRNKNNKFYCEIYDNVFLHYRAGGNWQKEGMKLHDYMSNKLKKVLL